MQMFLDAVAARHANERIVMVMDGAGRHCSKKLVAPSNVRLLALPPYAPELNPVEHLWDELREKCFHNKVFASLDALEDELEVGLLAMENTPELIQLITLWSWIIDVLSKWEWNYNPHMPNSPEIYCPHCIWRSGPLDKWACVPACGTDFNTFWTGGVCPGCGHHWQMTQCLSCQKYSPHKAWYHYKQGADGEEKTRSPERAVEHV